jgi:hypothetical protein
MHIRRRLSLYLHRHSSLLPAALDRPAGVLPLRGEARTEGLDRLFAVPARDGLAGGRLNQAEQGSGTLLDERLKVIGP